MALIGLRTRLNLLVGRRSVPQDKNRRTSTSSWQIHKSMDGRTSLLEDIAVALNDDECGDSESGDAGGAEGSTPSSNSPPKATVASFEEDENISGAVDSVCDERGIHADNTSECESSDPEDDGDYRRGARGIRGLPSNQSEDESDSDDDDLGSSSDDLMGNLPAGYLEFLSGGQSDIDEEISAITDQLCGRKKGGRWTGLFEIHFVRESLCDEGAINIARAMERGCSSCPICHVDPAGLNQVVTAIPRRLPCQGPSKFLREIVLSRCHIRDEGACAMAHAISISCTSSLKSLDLSSNDITGAGATCIANCVVTSNLGSCGGDGCNIETLVLSMNPIGSMGASALANALRGRHSECLSPQGLLEITSGSSQQDLSSNTAGNTMGYCSLKNLHVSGCELNDKSAIALGKALLQPNSLSETGLPSSPPPRTNDLMLLNIHGNQITSKGMEFLYSIIDNHSPHPVTNGQVLSTGDGIKMMSESGCGNGSDICSTRSLAKRTNQTSVWEIVT
jgi:hypothetical protein